MKLKQLHRLILAALLAALTCVATILIQIPSPMQGYVNLGDCIVLLAGWLLGPVYGFCAGAVGSALADVLTGYMHYVPGTFIIKGLMALVAALLLCAFKKRVKKYSLPGLIISSFAAEFIMVLGYFGYACLFLGKGLAAATSIPGNLIQAAAGIVVGILLYLLLSKIKPIQKSLE